MRSRFLIDKWVVTRVTLAVGFGVCALLGALSPASADDALGKWTAVLKSGDEKARVEAIDALGHMGSAAKAATRALAGQLNDDSPRVRAHAAYALMQIGPDAKEAAPALAGAIADPDFHVRRTAIAALERIQPDPGVVVKALGKALADEDHSVRVAALHTLTEYGDQAVPALSEALKDEDTRYWAALALGELGPRAKGAVEPLVAALKDDRPQVRREVLLALAHIGPDAAAAVPAITPLFEDPDLSTRYAAGFALGSIGPAAADAVDALHKELDCDDPLLGGVSCWALARIEPENKQARERAIAMLLETARDENPRVQSASLRALMDLQAEPKQLVPALGYVILNGEEPAVSEALGVLTALGPVGTEVISEALKRPAARQRAAMLVAHLGPSAKATVPALIAALDDKDAQVRREVLFALAAIGPEAAAATPALQKALDDAEMSNRAVAAYALGHLGPAAQAALPKLQEELTSPDALVRVASAHALVHVAAGNERVVRAALPVLVQGLQNPLPAARRGAAEALGQVGKPARSVSERALRAATSDSDESVRREALKALEKMGAVVDAPPERSVPPVPRR